MSEPRVPRKPYLSAAGTHVVVETRKPDCFEEHHTLLSEWSGGAYAPNRKEAEHA